MVALNRACVVCLPHTVPFFVYMAVEKNQNVAANHVIHAICLYSIHQPLAFAYQNLKEHFSGFIDHSIRIDQDFQCVGDVKPRTPKKAKKTGVETRPPDKRSIQGIKSQAKTTTSLSRKKHLFALNQLAIRKELIMICVTAIPQRRVEGTAFQSPSGSSGQNRTVKVEPCANISNSIVVMHMERRMLVF